MYIYSLHICSINISPFLILFSEKGLYNFNTKRAFSDYYNPANDCCCNTKSCSYVECTQETPY